MRLSICPIRSGIAYCFVLRGEGTILIDPGEPGKGRSLLRALNGIVDDPHDISLILATHGHWDHIGAVHELRRATGAGLAMHSADASWASTGDAPPLIHSSGQPL
jgi:glyoxylase-like metal-dependent hydrolase (beta-lactamase superfamily II)